MIREKRKDVIAGIFSLFFILIVFSLYFINLFSNNFYYESLFRNKEIKNYDLTLNSLDKINNSYSLNMPKEPTIILRIDDVRAYSTTSKPLIDEIIRRNMSATLGVIPRDLEKDKKIPDYLIEIKENSLIEIAQHGANHNESDINISEETLLEGNKKIQEIIGIKPITYIPPYNNISEESKEMIGDYFSLLSGDQDILKNDKIPEIGYTVSTYSYTTQQIVSNKEIISKCKQSLEKNNLCVVMIHPQEYSSDPNNPKEISPERFNDFKEMLDGLEKLESNFGTFKDLLI
jgi:hypothetical protein